MLKKIQERIFPFIIAFTALTVSGSAAFYSVSGLSKLFAGASLEVMIMAGSLEVAKLVIASLLYQYRKMLPLGLKVYLTTAAAVLVLITSMGIYGFLSAAYQETATKASNIESQITLLENQKTNHFSQLEGYREEQSNLNTSISDLREGLANNVIQYKDKETGQIISTTSSSNRRTLERQLDQALNRQSLLSRKADSLNQIIFDLETQIIETQTGGDLARELGPLKYLSGLTGISMDKIINWLLLVIIFVFDPLAIALVIAANFAFEKVGGKTRENIYGEKIPVGEKEPLEVTTEDDQEMGLWDVTLNDSLETEIRDSNLEEDEYPEPNEELKAAASRYKESEYESKKRQIIMGASDAKTKQRMLQNLSKEFHTRK